MKTILAAGGLVLNDQQALLMMFRRGKWDLPKGKLDEGETLEDCALREVMEETGLSRVNLLKPLQITHHQYFDQWLQEDVIKETHWYLMQAPGEQSLVPQTSEDITKLIWVNRDELAACLANTYETIIELIHTSNIVDAMA